MMKKVCFGCACVRWSKYTTDKELLFKTVKGLSLACVLCISELGNSLGLLCQHLHNFSWGSFFQKVEIYLPNADSLPYNYAFFMFFEYV